MNRAPILSLALALASLSGCATSTLMYGSDGKPYRHIECNGAVLTLASCYEKAQSVCPKGYFLASKDVSVGGISGGITQSGGAFGQPSYRSIVVGCKD
jgi:hypothetical protein